MVLRKRVLVYGGVGFIGSQRCDRRRFGGFFSARVRCATRNAHEDLSDLLNFSLPSLDNAGLTAAKNSVVDLATFCLNGLDCLATALVTRIAPANTPVHLAIAIPVATHRYLPGHPPTQLTGPVGTPTPVSSPNV